MDIRNTLKKSGIYLITNKINGKKYIGETNNLKRRFGQHKYALKCGNHPNAHSQSSVDKYGLENFKIEILELVDDIEQLELKEGFYIDKFNTMDDRFGYNFVKKDINTGKRVLSEETKNKIGNANKGENHGMFGKKLSEEHIEKIRQSNLGKKRSPEVGEKISRALTGKKLSEEHKEKISSSHKGKTLSKEHKKNLSKSISGENHPTYNNFHWSTTIEINEERKLAKEWAKIFDVSLYELKYFLEKNHLSYIRIPPKRIRKKNYGKC